LRIATFQYQGRRHVGLVSSDGQSVTPFELTPEQARTGALPFIEAGSDLAQAALQGSSPIAISAVKLEAPLPVPRRNIFCVGRNYHAHARELSASVFKNNNANPESWPIVFTKVPECVVGPRDDVVLPVGVSEQIDYESELAVVIGKGGCNISRAEAMGHVYGYTIVNDVTARDVQMRHQQWDLGKSFDTFCPRRARATSSCSCGTRKPPFPWEKKASTSRTRARSSSCTAPRWPRSRPSTCSVPGRPVLFGHGLVRQHGFDTWTMDNEGYGRSDKHRPINSRHQLRRRRPGSRQRIHR
jgi:hypothetical protein